MSLEEERRKIDALDAGIVKLLDDRARVSRRIGELKRGSGIPPFQPGREEEVLSGLARLSDGGMPLAGLRAVYRCIMNESKALQRGGEEGCRGHAAGGGKRDFAVQALENAEITPGFRRMRLGCPELGQAFTPGQFFQLRLGDAAGVFLRRPFAPSEYAGDGIAFVYAVVGRGTRALAGVRPGTELGVLAPLGNAYTLPPAGSRVLLAGGGCGAPSLLPLAKALRAAGVGTTAVLGARTEALLLEREAWAGATDRLFIATDDGSCGGKGTVVDVALAETDGLRGMDRIYSCGPVPMLRAVAAMAAARDVPCEVSLEERMACGFGACVGCVVPMSADGGTVYRRVCHDGPVFDAAVLAWGEIR